MPSGPLIIATDGACSGTFKKGQRGIGITKCGFVIRGVDNIYVLAHLDLGQHTISEAEYYGVIECLKFLQATGLAHRPITIFSDSQFMVRQLNGEYKVRAENIIPLYAFTKALLKDFTNCKIVHHSRETELAQQVDRLIHKGTI